MESSYAEQRYTAFRSSSELVVNPEFKKFIPKLSDDEYNGLVESLKKEGCRDPIIISGRTIIDGHNRYEICNRYNIPFKTIQMEFANQDEIKIWMIKNQFARRNLTTYQKAKLAIFLKPLFREKAIENKISALRGIKTPEKDKGGANKKSAELAGVGSSTVIRLERVLSHASPQIIDALEKGEIDVCTTYKNMFMDTKFKTKLFTLPVKLIKAVNSVQKHPEFQKKLEKALEQLVKELKKP